MAAESNTAPVAIKLYFHQDHSDFDADFRSNTELLDKFVQLTGIADNVNGPRIRVSSSASAEGPRLHNVDLSNWRAETICDILVTKYGICRDRIEVSGQETDWQDLLYQVNATTGLTDKEKAQVTDIITNVSAWTYDSKGNITDSRRKHLMDLNGGKTWRWMLDNIFYEQRYGIVAVVNPDGSSWQRSGDKGLVIDNLDQESISALDAIMHRLDSLARLTDELARRMDSLSGNDTLYIREDHYHYDSITSLIPVISGAGKANKTNERGWMQPRDFERIPIMAIRSNLLLPLMNIGMEFPIGNRLSVGIDHYFPWIWCRW